MRRHRPPIRRSGPQAEWSRSQLYRKSETTPYTAAHDAAATVGQNYLDARLRPGPFEDRPGDPRLLRCALVGKVHEQVQVGQLLLGAVWIGRRQVDFVDGDDDRHVGRARVIDGLTRLRHDAVVRGNHNDGDIGDLGSARRG